MMTLLYAYGIMCLISAIMFAFAVRNAEDFTDENLEDAEFIEQIEEYKKIKK